MHVQVWSILLLVSSKTSYQIKCLSNINDNKIEWNEDDPNKQLEDMTLHLMNEIQEKTTCPFQLSLWHIEHQLQVTFRNLEISNVDERLVDTMVQITTNNPIVTTIKGMCLTDMCDLQQVITAGRWMLFEGKTYSSIQKLLIKLLHPHIAGSNPIHCLQANNYNQFGECYKGTCYTKLNSNNYSFDCISTKIPSQSRLTTFVKLNKQQNSITHNLIYICKTNRCNSKENTNEIINLMWFRFQMIKLFETSIDMTTSSNAESSTTTTLKSTSKFELTTSKASSILFFNQIILTIFSALIH
ncbi:hypothetical protein I4U23_027043 [Adineta vaga]|nr:hypothetical protein I4U23_027043 [Adineta vaga]